MKRIIPFTLMNSPILRKVIFCFFFVFYIGNVFAQKQLVPFDSAFNHVIFHEIPYDVPKARQSADSLLRNSMDQMQRMKSLMLLASICIQTNDHEDAMVFALRAEDIAKETKDYEWQVRTAGFLSGIFRDVNLFVEAREHLKVVEEASEKMKESEDYDLIQINIYHEKAHFAWREGDYKTAIREVENAQKYIPRMKEVWQGGFYSSNYLMLGEIYLELEDYEKSAEYFHLILKNKIPNENLNYPAVYRGLGDIEMHKGNYDQAFDYFQKAEEYLSVNQHFLMRNPVYQSLARYYRQINRPEEAMYYGTLYIEGLKSSANLTQRLSNRLAQSGLAQKEVARKRNTRLLTLLGGFALLILVLVARLRIVRKRSRRRYKAFIEKTRAESKLLQSNGSQPFIKEDIENGSRLSTLKVVENEEASIMPKETEERLLNELEKLEEDEFFLNKEISLSLLAAELQTNIKYLSYLINTHKEKDFSNYIHELRIGFAVNKLRNDPKYLNYKLAYLAEECGYSSHSKFTSVFKSIVGLSPSAFVSYVKKEIEKEGSVVSDLIP